MSDITISRPELVNGHTDVICSTSIRHILAVRKSALLQIDTLIRQLAEISVLTESIGGKTALDWAMKQNFRCGCWLMEKPEAAMKAITRNLDREIWRDLKMCIRDRVWRQYVEQKTKYTATSFPEQSLHTFHHYQ